MGPFRAILTPVILIAGGTGHLGSVLVERLVERGAAVRILSREPSRAGRVANPRIEVVQGDVRDQQSLARAARGVDTIVSAMHGFSGRKDVSPSSVDRDGNRNLIDAAATEGADFVLVSIVGASPASPVNLFRAKYEAEQYLQRSRVGWTIVRATAFIETWAMVIGRPIAATGKATVFGRGDNTLNMVSTTDVAALLEIAVLDRTLRGQSIEIGGVNVTFNQFVAAIQHTTGRSGPVRHIPRGMLRAMSLIMRPFNEGLAGQAQAAIVMDTRDLSFDATPTRRRFPQIPNTDLTTALDRYFAGAGVPMRSHPR